MGGLVWVQRLQVKWFEADLQQTSVIFFAWVDFLSWRYYSNRKANLL